VKGIEAGATLGRGWRAEVRNEERLGVGRTEGEKDIHRGGEGRGSVERTDRMRKTRK